MTDWTPITRGKPEVHGIEREHPGLLDVSIPLSPIPTGDWAYLFMNPTGVGISLSMHPPRISGSMVHIRPPDAELEEYVRHVDARIASANRAYAEQVLPKLRSAATREARATADEQARLDEARRRAAGL